MEKFMVHVNGEWWMSIQTKKPQVYTKEQLMECIGGSYFEPGDVVCIYTVKEDRK